MIQIEAARTSAQYDDFRAMVREFRDWALGTFHPGSNFMPPPLARLDQELAALPGKYAPPEGEILIASCNGKTAGCLAGFRRDARSMEITRMWARPEFRGKGVGAALVPAMLQIARQAGYERAVLRSRREMTAAHGVYRKSGFVDMNGSEYFPDFANIEIAMEMPLASLRVQVR